MFAKERIGSHMAARRRGPGKPFVKGQTGNPKGSSSRKRELKKVANLTNQQVEEVASVILLGDRANLKALAESHDASVLQVWVSGLVVNSMKKGCSQTFRVLMDRVCGKPRETVELSGKEGGPMSLEVAHRQMSEAEMKIRADELARQRAEAGDD